MEFKVSKRELGYLVGLFIGDGYSNYNKNDRHYRVEFFLNSLTDKGIISNLVKILESLKLNYFISKDKRYNVNRIRINSKELMEFLGQKVSEFKKLKRFDNEYKIGLISGFIDAEGYVGHGEILLTQKDEQTLRIFKGLIESFDITTKMWPSKNYKGSGNIWRLRMSTMFKYVPHNSYKVRRAYSGAKS